MDRVQDAFLTCTQVVLCGWSLGPALRREALLSRTRTNVVGIEALRVDQLGGISGILGGLLLILL